MIETALANIKEISDVNTVIGDPMEAGGATIIPVSKVSVGFTSGGVDYLSKNAPDKGQNFGGGVGSGFSVTPMAFLVINKDGNVSLLTIDDPTGTGDNKLLGTVTGIIDKAPGIIEKLTKIFKKDKKENAESDSGSTAEVFTNADVEKISGGAPDPE